MAFLADLLCEGKGKPLPAGAGFPHSLIGALETRWREVCDTRRLSTAESEQDRKRVFRKVAGDLRNKQVIGLCDGFCVADQAG